MGNAVTSMIDSPSFGMFIFDAVFSTNHESNITITTQPVQNGANIADHAYIEPDSVTLEIGMTDAAVDAESNHSVNAYNLLRAIMEAREPLSLYTRLKNYTNMMVVSISAPDDYTTATALKASVMLQKILLVNVATVKVQQTVTASKTQEKTGNAQSSTPTTKKTTQTKQSTDSTKKTSVLQKLVNKAKEATAKPSTKATEKPTATAKAKLSKLTGHNFTN